MRFAKRFLRTKTIEAKLAAARDGDRRRTLHHANSRTDGGRIRGSGEAFRRPADKAVRENGRADGAGRHQKYPCKKEPSFLIPAQSSPQCSGMAMRDVAWPRWRNENS